MGVTINGDTVNSVTTTIPWENGVRTPGVWQYPVCSVELMLENWNHFSFSKKNRPCSSYPCYRKDWETRK